MMIFWESAVMNGIGDKFDDFMKEQGLYDEAKELAAKKLLAFQLE
jgi:hypothetical protein